MHCGGQLSDVRSFPMLECLSVCLIMLLSVSSCNVVELYVDCKGQEGKAEDRSTRSTYQRLSRIRAVGRKSASQIIDGLEEIAGDE